jgi:hypothetical protein
MLQKAERRSGLSRGETSSFMTYISKERGMRTLCTLVFVSGMAFAAAVFPAMAQQDQQQTPADHGAHHGGTDQQPGQQATGGQMMGGMMGSSQQGTMGSGMPGMGMGGCPMMGGMMGSGQQGTMGSGMPGSGCPMMGGMMGSGQQGTMGSGMQGMGMGGCPMMGGIMGSGMGMGMGMGGQQGMMGSAMQGMGPGMRGLFGSRVMPLMNLSVDDVRGYLAVQLDLLKNKRLKIGEVKSDNGTITADIMTVDNSLVQRLKVNQHTGIIEYQN